MVGAKAGIVDIVTGAGAMRCGGLWEAPADGWLLIFLIVLILLIVLIFPIVLICGGYAGVVTFPRAHSLCWKRPGMSLEGVTALCPPAVL